MPNSGDYDLDQEEDVDFGEGRVSHEVLVERVRHMVRSINYHRRGLEKESVKVAESIADHGKQLRQIELWQTKIVAYVTAASIFGGICATLIGKVIDHAWK